METMNKATAAAYLGCSVRTLERMVEAGTLVKCSDCSGEFRIRFDSSYIKQLSRVLNSTKLSKESEVLRKIGKDLGNPKALYSAMTDSELLKAVEMMFLDAPDSVKENVFNILYATVCVGDGHRSAKPLNLCD